MKNLLISILLGMFAIGVAFSLKPTATVGAQVDSDSEVITATTTTEAITTTVITLTMGRNSGRIGANETLWFSFQPEGEPFMQLPMTLFIIPNENNAVKNIHLELFEPGDELDLGASSIVSRDGNPDTGELSWRGWVEGEKNYIVRLQNENNSSFDYWLFTEDVVRPNLSLGKDIANPFPLEISEEHLEGVLQPGEERWYVFTPPEVTSGAFQPFNMTVYFTPNNNKYNLDMHIFDETAPAVWAEGNELEPIGAGTFRFGDDDPNTGEIEWGGNLIKDTLHYVRLRNESPVPMNYFLFTYEIEKVSVGELE